MSEASSEAREILFEEAYKRLLSEYDSLRGDELVAINLDIASTVSTVLGVSPRLASLTARIAQELPDFDLRVVQKLDEYAMALSHADTLFSLASQGVDPLRPLVEEGRKLRGVLIADAVALARRGHLPAARLKDLRGSKAYQNLAFDLQLLSALFGEALPQVADKSGVQQHELLRAQQIAAGIVRALGLREQDAATMRAAADTRVRAFTLLTRAYNAARRAVSYLRWDEGDVQKIVPSLYTGRGGRKRDVAGEAVIVPR